MSGYEKSPDYAGPDPSWRERFVIVLVSVAITGAIWVLRRLLLALDLAW